MRIEERLLARAGYRCEYCKISLRGESAHKRRLLHLHGAEQANAAIVVCSECEASLGGIREASDPVTGRRHRLFNPRIDEWGKHFLRAGREIRGRDGIGRVTCLLLSRRGKPDSVADLAWDKIRDIPWEEPLYQYLNKLRFLRLKNSFEELLPEMSAPLDRFGARQEYEEIGVYARHLLFLETCFTRSGIADVRQGIALGERLCKEHRHDPVKLRQLAYILSILYQQLATTKFLGGSVRLPRQLQETALRYDQMARTRFVDSPITTTLGAALRTHTVARRYDPHEVGGGRISGMAGENPRLRSDSGDERLSLPSRHSFRDEEYSLEAWRDAL